MEAAQELSIPFWTAAPPRAQRHVSVTFDFTDDKVDAIFAGNLYPLGSSMRDAGIGGDYGDADASGRREYFRVVSQRSIVEETGADEMETYVTSVVSNTLLRCVVRTAPPDDSQSAEFLERLKASPQLRFADP